MKYQVKDVCQLLRITSRTLRYYEQCGLLLPERDPVSGYRVYQQGDLNRIVIILIYRELGYNLKSIKLELDKEGSISEEKTKELCSELVIKKRKISSYIDDLEEQLNELKKKGH